jgi:WD40 repeat protein
VSPNDGSVWTGHSDGAIRQWSADGKINAVLKDASHLGETQVQAVAMLSNNRLVGTYGDGALRIWRRDGVLLETRPADAADSGKVADRNFALGSSRAGDWFASARSANVIEIWSSADPTPMWRLDPLLHDVEGSMSGSNRRTSRRVQVGLTAVHDLEVGPGDDWLVAAVSRNSVGTLVGWSMHDERLRPIDFVEHDSPIGSLSISPCGTMIATAGYDGYLRIWHLYRSSGQRWSCSFLTEVRLDGLVSGCAWSPDGQRLACASFTAVTMFQFVRD